MMKKRKQKKAEKIDPLARRWNAAVGKWKRVLWLTHWRIDTSIQDRQDATPNVSAATPASFGTIAQADTISCYRQSEIKLTRGSIASKNPKEMNESACHEVLHVVVAPYDAMVQEMLMALPQEKREGFEKWHDQAKEELVTHLQNVFIYEEAHRA